jgi:hypothetical protein
MCAALFFRKRRKKVGKKTNGERRRSGGELSEMRAFHAFERVLERQRI